MKKYFLLLSLLTASVITGSNAESQTLSDYFGEEETSFTEPSVIFRGTRFGSGQSVETTPAGELHLLIQHRFGTVTNGLYDLFGLDLATMRLGFDYGVTNWFSASIGRSTFLKMYDAGVKFAIMKQSDQGSPVSISLGGSAMVNTMRNYFPENNDNLLQRSIIGGELIAARSFGSVAAQLSQNYVHRKFDVISGSSDSWMATGLGLKIRISKRVDLTGDYYISLKDNTFSSANPWSFGADLDTGGHLFQLYFSNTTGLNAFSSPYLASGSSNGSDLFFGFNLVRVFYP